MRSELNSLVASSAVLHEPLEAIVLCAVSGTNIASEVYFKATRLADFAAEYFDEFKVNLTFETRGIDPSSSFASATGTY